MKRNRKILAVAGAAVLVIAIGTASVLGVSAHAKNTAKETALKYLPADAQLVAQETEDDRANCKSLPVIFPVVRSCCIRFTSVMKYTDYILFIIIAYILTNVKFDISICG